MPYTAFTYGDPSVQAPEVEEVAVALVAPTINTSPDAFSPPFWGSIAFPDPVVGVAYLEQFDLHPAAAPTTFALQSGALPDGLALATIGDDVGRISGTPTTAGSFTFTIRASNDYGTADKSFTLTVHPSEAGGSSGGAWIWSS